MKSKTLYFMVAVLMAPPAFVRGADLCGSWTTHEPGMQAYQGELLPMQAYREEVLRFGETVFTFRVDGSKLTGTILFPNGKRTAISEGRVNGDEISFIAVRSLSGREVKLLYKGEVFGDEIRFTRKAQDGSGKPQEFIAEREFRRNGDIPVQRKWLAPVEAPPYRGIYIPPEK